MKTTEEHRIVYIDPGGNTREEQKAQVKRHLQVYGKITSWEAINLYNITRLSSYILMLRKEKYPITTRMVDNANNDSRHAVYELETVTLPWTRLKQISNAATIAAKVTSVPPTSEYVTFLTIPCLLSGSEQNKMIC